MFWQCTCIAHLLCALYYNKNNFHLDQNLYDSVFNFQLACITSHGIGNIYLPYMFIILLFCLNCSCLCLIVLPDICYEFNWPCQYSLS